MDKAIDISMVPRHLVSIVWPTVYPLLEEAIDRSNGEANEESVFKRIASGDTSLFIATDMGNPVFVFILEQVTYESGKRSLVIPFVGGRQVFEVMQQFIDYIADIAENLNCDDIRGMSVRKGWIRQLEPYGWESVHEVIRYKIRGKS